MTRTGLALALWTLGTATAAAAPCSPSATALCLSGGRFEVKVAWKDFQGKTGDGQAVSLTADTGTFWFFDSSNVELIVKVLDARTLNGKFWVFFGALSNVEYDLHVTDSATGASKTYHNPSGQFASVGDTGAFAGSAGVVLAARETVTVTGTRAAPDSIEVIQRFVAAAAAAPRAPAAAPCDAASTGLLLSGCRFRVEAHWTDAQGNSGSGQAVPLTSDTGYFWFFNSSNVELMIKVLDARPINGKFWVFFGALSNVAYTINVVDTVSGALHSYENPQNTFASVGDTAAFRGGYGVAVEADTARAVSGSVTAAAGGSLSATAADGTVFTLNVPPNAITDDEDVTITPVRATGAFPFAGGLAAGVDLQPSGLVILSNATLSIHTPAPISRSEETPVAWNGSGEDFFLFPPSAAGGDLELSIQHLGGYGVARGTDGERDLALSREPVSDDDFLSHRTSPLLRLGRAAAPGARAVSLEATADWRSDLQAIYFQWFSVLRDQMIATDGEPAVVVDLAQKTLSWKAQVERALGPLDAVYKEEIRLAFESMFSKALQKIHDRCADDPGALVELPQISNLVQTLAVHTTPSLDDVLQCLTFQLKFESTITYGPVVSDRGTSAQSAKGLAELTLETQRSPAAILTAGEGTINIVEMVETVTPNRPGPQCTITTSSSPAPFKAFLRWKNLLRSRALRFELLYDPGFPSDKFTTTCPGEAPDVEENFWWGNYYVFHEVNSAGAYPFSQGDWTMTGRKDPWAQARVTPPPRGLTSEKTNFTLTHTPR